MMASSCWLAVAGEAGQGRRKGAAMRVLLVELLARMRAVVRRSGGPGAPQIVCGVGYFVDART
ncbi:MAG: hypothetical protein JWP60_3113 [Ramlibacter sp.]|nr:hypothetical protein [Ramlibacter sp.]